MSERSEPMSMTATDEAGVAGAGLGINPALALWGAMASGTDAAYAALAEAQARATPVDRETFARLADMRRRLAADPGLAELAGRVDPHLVRLVEVAYRRALPGQAEPGLRARADALSRSVERAQHRHAAAWGVRVARPRPREAVPAAVRAVLRSSSDEPLRRGTWEAFMAVGGRVAGDLAGLVALRNEQARQGGFDDFYELVLFGDELDRTRLLATFDEVDRLTRGPYRAAKARADAHLARARGIAPRDLRPWHYHDPHASRAPSARGADPDAPYRGADLPRAGAAYFRSIGLPLDDVLARSDLHGRPGKSPAPFCLAVGPGDVRIMMVLDEGGSAESASTLLHEMGHAAYEVGIDPGGRLPELLRMVPNPATTEGVAILFEGRSWSAAWLAAAGVRPAADPAVAAAAARAHRDDLLFHSRWCQVVTRFEMAMYRDPGCDLDTLWWDLVEEYQEIRRPEGRRAGDYASASHLASSPCYHHHYLLGLLLACQLRRAIAADVPASAACDVGRREVGAWLGGRVFAPGASRRWDELVRHATGSDLSVAAFMEEVEAAASAGMAA